MISGYSRSSSMGSPQQDSHKRLRAGSVSGRLRTASDLQEWGWIDKSQKGILKDLIISGNQTLRNALDKFSDGDSAELQALIRQGIFSRKHSVDLLDGLDLDFLTMDNAGENLAEFDSFGPDEQYSFVLQFGNKHLSDQVLDSADDGNFNAQPSSSAAVLSAMDGDWFDSHVDATIPRTSSIGGSNFHLRKNSLLSGDLKDWGTIDYGEIINPTDAIIPPPSEIFEDVDLSLYKAMAVHLQKTNPIKPTKKVPGPKMPSTPLTTSKVSTRSFGDSGPDASSKKPNLVMSTGKFDFEYLANQGEKSRIKFDSTKKHNLQDGHWTADNIGTGNNSTVSANATGVSHATNSNSALTLPTIQNDDGSLIKMPPDYIGAYSPESRKERIERFIEKRNRRVWTKKVKYDVRKNFADSRLRVKGRFVKKEDEELMRELLTI